MANTGQVKGRSGLPPKIQQSKNSQKVAEKPSAVNTDITNPPVTHLPKSSSPKQTLSTDNSPGHTTSADNENQTTAHNLVTNTRIDIYEDDTQSITRNSQVFHATDPSNVSGFSFLSQTPNSLIPALQTRSNNFSVDSNQPLTQLFNQQSGMNIFGRSSQQTLGVGPRTYYPQSDVPYVPMDNRNVEIVLNQIQGQMNDLNRLVQAIQTTILSQQQALNLILLYSLLLKSSEIVRLNYSDTKLKKILDIYRF